ncbi:MAG TPA: ATP-binding cassette domain-containing protein [Acidimicrobiales bacterium]
MNGPAIELRSVTFRHHESSDPVLHDVDLTVDEGELCLVVGRTGVGKSTLLSLVNGLAPHFTGGRLDGRVRVEDRDTRDHLPRDLAEVVGHVGQDPAAGFVTDRVEEELAYGMEQLGLAPDVMRRRVEETLDLLGIAPLRDRPLRMLSGGEQQRVAIGAVLAAHPRVLLLDEPTSALDPVAAEDVLATIARLVHDLGVTVLAAEHRLERMVHHADRVAYLPGGGQLVAGEPGPILGPLALAPPVVRLGRLMEWSPLPLSVRDARRLAGPLRDRLRAVPPTAPAVRSTSTGSTGMGSTPVLRARRLVLRHGAVTALRSVDIDLLAGEVVALMGRNGAGKSSLLWSLQGGARLDGGSVDAGGLDPSKLGPKEARAIVGMVPQTPADLLYLTTVADELAQGDRDADRPPGACQAVLDRLGVDLPPDRHPRDLSEGQRLSLVLAIQLASAPPVVLLDEPTRGLDPSAKEQLATILRSLAGSGHAVVVATHDVEFVAEVADRVVVMAEGEIVADGPTAETVCSSPAFAPQVAKVLQPEPWLTVAQVAAALQSADAATNEGRR